MSPLTPLQQIICDCATAYPNRFTRSTLAKLLVGSSSARLRATEDNPFYGRLAGHGRKAITDEVDSLLQQGVLATDSLGRVVPAAGAAGR